MPKLTSKLVFDKTTPGTHKYREVEVGEGGGDNLIDALNPLVRNIYLCKPALAAEGIKTPPKFITITVEIEQ